MQKTVGYDADKNANLPMEITSFALDWMPGVGDIKGIAEAIAGYDMAGNKLTFAERVLAMACLSELRGIGKVADYVKDSGKFLKNSEMISGLLKHSDEVGHGGKVDHIACFTEDTLVLTKEGHKLIKDVKVGDEVYCINPETGEKGLKKVEETFIRETETLIHVYVDGEHIKTTIEHPFWVVGEGWIEASQLRIGDLLLMYSGKTASVENVIEEKLEGTITVYNFMVADWHTYLVTGKDILVHNTCAQGVGNARKIKSVDDVLKGATPRRTTKGRATQYCKTGGYDQALNDFNSMGVADIKDIPGGKVGKLPDGRTINVRINSSDGRPTLEIFDGKNSTKIRYDD